MRRKLIITIFILAMITAIVLALPLTAEASGINQPTYSTKARETLSNYDKALYDQLFTKIQALKNSDAEQSTRFDIDLNNLGGAKTSWSQTDKLNFPAGITKIADAFFAQFDFEKIIFALMYDMPLELYWYDKTTGSNTSIASNDSSVTTFSIRMSVTNMHKGESYQDSYPTVKGVKTSYDTTYENAMQYVLKYEGKSDYIKIKGYVQEICDLVLYEEDNKVSYCDIWQATYVFDNDTTTNVVCEGYSKAFQLLCNLSTFSNTNCYTISGFTCVDTPDSQKGAHMWNVVTIDGVSYLVDVTNSDSNAIGKNGDLILKAPKSGSYETYYFFETLNEIYYSYNEQSKSLWGEELLTLSSADYVVPSVNVTLVSQAPSGGFVYDGDDVTIGANSSYDVFYNVDVGNVNDYSWSSSYYQDDNGNIGSLVPSIRDVGVYWIKVTATDTVDSTVYGSASIKIQVAPKPFGISYVTASGKIYDKTTSINIDSAVLNGILASDDVRLSTSSTFSLPQADAGEYNYLLPNDLVFEGSDKDNYVYSLTEFVTVSQPITVTKRTIDTSAPVFEYIENESTFEQFDFEVTGLYDGAIENGTIKWYDSNLPITDLSTTIVRGKVYTWEIIFNNSNYNNATGTVEIYPDEAIYKVTATVDDLEKGTVSLGGREGYLAGETVTVTAVAKDGYQFDCWVVNGEEGSNSSTYIFTASDNVTVEARFKIAPTSQTGEGNEGDVVGKILEILKILIPYLPHILIGGGALILIILIILYIKISKSAKRKKKLKNINK